MAFDSHFDARPSRIRYFVLALTTMVAVLLYLDRICLSYFVRYVREDLGITKTEMGLVLSSFFWTYAIGQLPAGWLSDRFGARLMLALFLAIWSTFTGLLAFAYGMLALVALRLGCGLFEAGAYPAAAGIIRNWIPLSRRGLASGIVSVGGRLGGAAAPFLSGLLMVAFVPVSVSSLVAPSDLLDPAQLISKGTYASETRRTPGREILSRRVFERLPMDDRQSVTSGVRLSDPEFRARLADALNRCLGMADFLDGIDLAEFNLPAEALRLLTPSPTTRTLEEIQRRNRLVLEVAFPQAIRKVYGAGWRPVMMVYWVVGLVVACIFGWLFRDSPRLHRACNAAEITFIQGKGGVIDPDAPPRPLPFKCLLISIGLWISSLVQLLTNFGWAFLITWLPDYLGEKYNVPPVTLGVMTSLPICVGMAGMFWGGWLTDHMTLRLGLRWGRAAPLALTRFVVAGAFASCLFLDSAWSVTIALSLVALATDLGTPAIWAYSMDVGGKHVGSVLGWSNMFGNFGAGLSSILLPLLLENSGANAMFLACVAALALAGVLSLFLDATKPVVPAKRLAA